MRQWLFERRAADFDQMTDLPKAVREQLAAEFQIWSTQIAAHRKANDGTEKLLLDLDDAERIECVLLRDDRGHWHLHQHPGGLRHALRFCASGLDGVVRNLTTGEIIEQMLQLQRLLAADERLSHVVVMGMGEPLANLDSLLPALALATAPTAWASAPGASPSRRSACRRASAAWPGKMSNIIWPFHSTPPTMRLRDQLVPANRRLASRPDGGGRRIFRDTPGGGSRMSTCCWPG